ncbi:MAG: hypothetical protein V3T70_09935 [Phycisphaerae bacterium]
MRASREGGGSGDQTAPQIAPADPSDLKTEPKQITGRPIADELADLKTQLQALQERLDRLQRAQRLD